MGMGYRFEILFMSPDAVEGTIESDREGRDPGGGV